MKKVKIFFYRSAAERSLNRQGCYDAGNT